MVFMKKWHLTLSATDSSNTKNIRISKNTILFLGISTFVFLMLLIGSIFYVIQNQYKIYEAHQILEENDQLKDKIYSLSSEIDSILVKLKLMEEWEDKVRSDKNFKEINKDIRNMGMGGIPQIDSTFINLGKEFNLNYNHTLNKLNQLKSKVDFDLKTHHELADKVELKKLLYLQTPSIYPTYGRISDTYGWRKHPITGKRSFHKGIDFGNVSGTPIYATADGIIKKSSREKYFGKYIVITHKFGYQTKYAHLQKSFVKSGQTVKRGEIIGLMGNSGRSTGNHLHYEVLRYNQNRNPYKYLNKSEDEIVLSKK
ncbi:MAG TPA: M23 family metallopeptidase [Candidatus Cloacimonetes bacterium]|nr:M23 family metallopeptidase [Candidatus Cloacimonadota bacterium]